MVAPKHTKQIITNPHDQFFREAMKDQRVSKDFLQKYLPADLCELVDFDHLVLQPRSQSNAVRRESIVDLLFKTYITGKEAYIYILLEHQSTPEPIMAFRVIEYTVNAIRDHLKKHDPNKIPLIFPMVVYHGRPYQFVCDINDLVDAPRALVDQFFLKPFKLIDLNKIEDHDLKKHMWSGLMEFSLKHIFARDLLPFLKDFAPVLRKLLQNDGANYIGIVLQYVIESAEINDNDALIEFINTNVSYEVGEQIMTAVEKWRQEGEIKGRQEGRQEGEIKGRQEGKFELIKAMLSNGVEPVFIAKTTGVPVQEIKILQKNLRN